MVDPDYPPEEVLEAFVELLHDLRRAPTLEIGLQRLVDTAMVLTPAMGASIRLFDETHENLVALVRCGEPVHESDTLMGRDEGLVGWVAKHGDPGLVVDTLADERFLRRPDQRRDVRSLICAPLYSRGEVLGVLGAWHSEPGAFHQVHLDYLQLLANCGTPSIEVSRLERLALTDATTRVFNRSYIDHRVSDEISRAHRLGRPLALAIIALDRYDQLKALGHVAHRAALRQLANRARQTAQKQEVFARYSEDTFVVVIPESDAQAGCAEATRFLHAVTSALADSLPPGVSPDIVTVSMGLSVLRPSDDVASLIGRAGEALAGAQRRGGNVLEARV